jgi:hypothetical protein
MKYDPQTLSIAHIYDGEEVVTAFIDCPIWVATFESAKDAQLFIKAKQNERSVDTERGYTVAESIRQDIQTCYE